MVATYLENLVTWKTQGIRKIVKISEKTQGNLNFCREIMENVKYVTKLPMKL